MIVVHEPPTMPIQWLVAAYQFFRCKHWKTTHTAFLVEYGKEWLQCSLGWDGFSLTLVSEFDLTYRAVDVTDFEVDTATLIDRLQLLVSLHNVLDNRFRYNPWGTLAKVLGNPAWFNCASLASFVTLGYLVDEPGTLHDILEVQNGL